MVMKKPVVKAQPARASAREATRTKGAAKKAAPAPVAKPVAKAASLKTAVLAKATVQKTVAPAKAVPAKAAAPAVVAQLLAKATPPGCSAARPPGSQAEVIGRAVDGRRGRRRCGAGGG